MSGVVFVALDADGYARAKRVLDRAKHPGFVGRDLYMRCVLHGSACVAVLDGEDVGVGLVVRDKLQAMSVVTAAQGRGVGAALLAHIRPRWVNAIGERVEWFEKRGYVRVGEPRPSQNGKHLQQLLERSDAADTADNAPPPNARVIAPRRNAPPPKARVGEIMDLMLRQRYVPGVTAPEKAAEWGLAINTVEADASEAKHLLELLKEPEAVREIAMVECSKIVAESGNDRVPALRLMLEATGNLKQRHEVTLQAKPAHEVYADALLDDGLRAALLNDAGVRAFLVAHGWRPPETIDTTGQEITEP